MADPAAMRQALVRLGFTQDAANAITQDQGIDSMEELKTLKDSEVKDLCDVVRKPGGTIPNPNAAVAGQPATIRDPGIKVSLRAEGNLKLTCYWLRHLARTSRNANFADIQVDTVRTMKTLVEQEEAHDDPKLDEGDKIVKLKDWSRTMENIQEALRGHLGTTKVPLSYVIRENVAVPDANTDPAFGMPNSKYVSVLDEMIGRAPIRNAADDGYEQSYLVDREKVWDLMTKICASYPECWTYIKTAMRARDGRAAYEALYTQYLGPHNVDNMADAAERKLSTLTYQGETKRWNFEKYCRAHTEQHQILTNLIEHGHSGIDERSKVRHFMNGIKGNMFDTVRLQIDADNDLRNDFERVKTLYSDFIKRKFPDQGGGRHANISALGTDAEATDWSLDELRDVKIEDRYYTREEYKSLSSKQKAKLFPLRQADGRVRKKKRVTFDSSTKAEKKLTKKVKKMARTVAMLQKKAKASESKDDDSNSGDDEPTSERRNRDSPALTRQRGRQQE